MNATARIERTWPDRLCDGKIRYGYADSYDGFFLADAQDGIPTFGSVHADSIPKILGHHVRVFNYPGQTEAIAKQLCDRWNAHPVLVDALREAKVQVEILQERLGIKDTGAGTLSIINTALASVEPSETEHHGTEGVA